MTRHKEQSWGGSRMQSFHALPLWCLDTNLLARRCVHQPGSSPALQCPEFLWEFSHLCMIDLTIGHGV